jgi:cobalt-zinc-cadmium efflux system outer membrane protein
VQVLASQLRVDLRERLARLATEAVDVTMQLFNVGAADRPDVLASEMEAALVRVELTEARNRLARGWQQLAAAVGRPDLPQQPLAGSVDTPLPELSRDETWRAALETSPELATVRASITRAERELTLARRQPVPDLRVRLGPHRDASQTDPVFDPDGWQWNIEAGLTIPLWNRNRGGVTAAQARLSQMRAEAQALELQLRDRFAVEYEQYLSALRRAEVYRVEVLPRASEAYKLYLDKYRQMAAAYPQVLITQRALFEVTDKYLEAVEQVRTSAIALQALIVAR